VEFYFERKETHLAVFLDHLNVAPQRVNEFGVDFVSEECARSCNLFGTKHDPHWTLYLPGFTNTFLTVQINVFNLKEYLRI
jgi:hypothetical protein